MKLLIAAQNFQMGGIQRALLNMLDVICKDTHYEIDLFVFGNGPLINDIPSNVNIIKGKRLLRLVATPFSIVKNSYKIPDIISRVILMLKVRLIGPNRFYHWLFSKEKKLGKYDVAISYFNDVPYNYFNQGTMQFIDEFVDVKKKIGWIHNDPIDANFDKEDCRIKYKNFDVIVCVSEACSRSFMEFLPEYSERVVTLYNFFPIEKIKSMAAEEIEHITSNYISIVTVSRIDNKQKRLNVIPEIVNRLIKSDITNFTWTVVGDGPDLVNLKNRVNELNINKYLYFIGNKLNPYPYIKASSLFVLVSKYEGYGMVIGEALILGIPVLTTNFAAAKEQIINGKNGIIVDMDENDIYSKLSKVLTNSKSIQEMKNYILENPYSNDSSTLKLKSVIELDK